MICLLQWILVEMCLFYLFFNMGEGITRWGIEPSPTATRIPPRKMPTGRGKKDLIITMDHY
uniref:Putative ovule protein n=1 Tax=Solanum chacoense TaxID=4108 RepID=A0A0V0H1K7_SOLCH